MLQSACQLNGFRAKGLTIKMAVAPDYQGSNRYSVSSAPLTRVKAAVSKAKSIVKKNAGKSSYEKLVAYKEAICKLVSYNHDAAAGSAGAYGDPWQLINVFDGDSSTNVVCEGYSKAFQYLCDLSDFEDVNCYTVSGEFTTESHTECHMWNIVRMDDGKNYLADVTKVKVKAAGNANYKAKAKTLTLKVVVK